MWGLTRLKRTMPSDWAAVLSSQTGSPAGVDATCTTSMEERMGAPTVSSVTP